MDNNVGEVEVSNVIIHNDTVAAWEYFSWPNAQPYIRLSARV